MLNFNIFLRFYHFNQKELLCHLATDSFRLMLLSHKVDYREIFNMLYLHISDLI